ncbi:MAG: NUDIX hydrolase [Holdemanella sp.]|nr:NUDIX hydrolase [Holdemanella sp.]
MMPIHGKEYQRDVLLNQGAVSMLVLKDDKILLVKQYRCGIEMDTLELPAGKLEYGENPLECAIRELNEETGLQSDEFVFIQKMAPIPAYGQEIVYIYEAKDVYEANERFAMDEDEDLELYWIPLNDAYEMTLNGQIIDSKTVIAIQHAVIQKYRKGDAE